MTCLTSPTLCHSDCHLRLLSIRNVETPTIQPNTLLDKKKLLEQQLGFAKSSQIIFLRISKLTLHPSQVNSIRCSWNVRLCIYYACIVHDHRVLSAFMFWKYCKDTYLSRFFAIPYYSADGGMKVISLYVVVVKNDDFLCGHVSDVHCYLQLHQL